VTHQFFLSKHSMYFVCFDPRLSPEANRLDYWIDLVCTTAVGSPVVLVGKGAS
jgi:hypothetical protein